ncbi:MAG: TonB-dependent receptor [Achromobacter veterisilvae]
MALGHASPPPLVPFVPVLLSAVMGLAGIAMPAPVRAQATETSAGALRRFDIPAGTLDQALSRYGRQAGVSISVNASLTAGLRSAGLSGSHTAAEALDLLLAGTGLQAEREGRGEYTLRRIPDAPRAEGGIAALPAITVTGRSAGELPPAYAGGQVATGGRVGLLGEKDFMETPFSTIVYTEDYIQDIQAQDVYRVIGLTDPAVYLNGSTGMITEYFNLRGFGVSANDIAYNGLYGMIPYYRATAELAERIEVLKGPSALLNGMPPGGSVGGSINVVPKRAGDKPLARVTGTYASDSQFGVHVDVGQRFGDEKLFGIRFNGVYRDGDTGVDDQSKRTKLAALGLDWRTRRVRLSADFYTSEDHLSGLNRGVSLAPGVGVPKPPKPDTLLAPDWTFTNTKDDAIMLRGEVDIADNLTAYAAWGNSETDFQSLASSTNTIFNDRGDYRNNFSFQRIQIAKNSAEIGTRARFRTLGVGHELALTGTYYQHDYKFGFQRNMLAKDWITNIYDPAWGPGVDTGFRHATLPKTAELRTTSYGIADTLSFAGDRVLFTAGVRRQNVVSDTFDPATGERTARYDAGANTPAFALLVKATDRLSLYGNYIEGLSQGATAPVTAVNAGQVFPPYKTKQREVGVKVDLGSFAGTVSAFQIERPSAYTDPFTNVYSFGGEQRNRGLEFGFFGELAPDLRLLGGISYTQAKLTKTAGGVNQGRTATGVPAWQGKLGVEWDVPVLQGLTLTGNVVSMSKQYVSADNALSVPGRTVYDVGARYRATVADHPVTLRANVLNLTNKAYWAGGLGNGLGAPRTFLLSASVEF